jgi:hypothetical protein
MHAPSVIAPAAALRRRAAVAVAVAVRNLPRCGAHFRLRPRAASCSLAQRPKAPAPAMHNLLAACGRLFGRG